METHDQDNVVRRLRSLGSQPVEPEVADQHASFLRAATPGPASRRMRPLLAGALLAGTVLGGTGLAAALPGSLPEQASSVAKSALAAVNLVDDDESSSDKGASGEHGKSADAKADKEADTDGPGSVERFLAGCTAGTPPVPFVGNHGQYVKAHADDPATADVNERQVAAESDCGKPLDAIADEAGDTDEEKAAKAAKAKDEADAADDAQDGTSEDAGRPEAPGKSEEEHPPADAGNQQGSENRNTETGKAGDSGKAGEHRPEGVGPGTTTTTTAG